MGLNRRALEHAARTTAAATVSLAIARLFHLPEAQWAAISTMVVTQSTLGAALAISGERFAGTALGVTVGALLATYLGSGLLAFGLGVFLLGLICAILRLDRAAYRFAGIAAAIVMLVARDRTAWMDHCGPSIPRGVARNRHGAGDYGIMARARAGCLGKGEQKAPKTA